MPLSGKTTVAQIMGENGYEILDMGEVVRKEMEKRNIESGNEGRFVNKQRKEKGMDAIAQLSTPYLEEKIEKSDKIVITGMRGWNEKKRFEKETGEDIEIVSVWASRETRRKRREDRHREEDVKGQSFHERDLREIENGVGKLMALSDQVIINDGVNLNKLREKVKEAVRN